MGWGYSILCHLLLANSLIESYHVWPKVVKGQCRTYPGYCLHLWNPPLQPLHQCPSPAVVLMQYWVDHQTHHSAGTLIDCSRLIFSGIAENDDGCSGEFHRSVMERSIQVQNWPLVQWDFNILTPYMKFLHLNWYIAEWDVGNTLKHRCTDLFMCNTVHIGRHNVKSHWKVQGRKSTLE